MGQQLSVGAAGPSRCIHRSLQEDTSFGVCVGVGVCACVGTRVGVNFTVLVELVVQYVIGNRFLL